ncbi:hypothetical protein ACGFY7_22920 [Streptomyces prunicolor]|uniref:hypothetical protein n=1 Tax=Streptomyces prunicolor TaxID=67348 RepID=UPI00371A5E36
MRPAAGRGPVEARERGILKLWFGGPPDALAPVRLGEHETSLRGGYEELADGVGTPPRRTRAGPLTTTAVAPTVAVVQKRSSRAGPRP